MCGYESGVVVPAIEVPAYIGGMRARGQLPGLDQAAVRLSPER